MYKHLANSHKDDTNRSSHLRISRVLVQSPGRKHMRVSVANHGQLCRNAKAVASFFIAQTFRSYTNCNFMMLVAG